MEPKESCTTHTEENPAAIRCLQEQFLKKSVKSKQIASTGNEVTRTESACQCFFPAAVGVGRCTTAALARNTGAHDRASGGAR